MLTPNALVPAKEEISALDPLERAGFRLAHRMNQGRWKRFWTFCQRHVGSLWIYLATYNLLKVYGLENIETADPNKPLVLVANHRSFFDMYVVSSVLFRRTRRPITLFFPVRARFFYDNPLGWLVNFVMGWWSMYPPFFRETGDAAKREFDKYSMRRLIEICSGVSNGQRTMENGQWKMENDSSLSTVHCPLSTLTVIGFHPEGMRNKSGDPYSFLPAQPGIGKIIYSSKPQVIPVFIAGLGNKLGKQVMGNWTGGEKIRVWFGSPIDLNEFYEKRDSLRTHKEIADYLMEKIAELGEKDRSFHRRDAETQRG